MDNETQCHPFVLFVEYLLSTDFGVEIAEGSVIGSELVDIRVDLLLVDVSLKEHRDRRAGINLSFEPLAARELVPDKLDFPNLLGSAFINDEHNPVIGRFVAFQDADLNVVVST